MNAKTLDDRPEPVSRPAIAQSADLGTRQPSAGDLTIEDFAVLIGDVTGQLDLLDATIELAGAAKVERELAVIAPEVRILTAQVRQAADRIAAAVKTSGRISQEVATALAGIKEAVQHIAGLIANAATAEMVSRASLEAIPPLSLRN
jgi:methyl-accepting chemotaxis protein